MQIYSIEITFVHYPNQIIIMQCERTETYTTTLDNRITQYNRFSIYTYKIGLCVIYRWYYVDTDDCIKEEIIVLIWIYVRNEIIQ